MPDYILPEQAPTLEQMSTPNPHLEQLPGPINTDTKAPVADNSHMNTGEDLLTKMSHTANPESIYEPSFFDWDKTDAQKFVNSRQYQSKGFDPEIGEGNELKYAQGQTGWDETKRMVSGFAAGLGQGAVGMISNYKNFANWTPSMQDAFKQDQLEEINKKQKEFDDNYHIFQGDNPTWFSSIAKGVQSSGHFIGALAEIAAETFAIQSLVAGTFGAAAPLETLEAADLTKFGAEAGADIAAQTLKTVDAIQTPGVIGNAWKNLGEFTQGVGKVLPGLGNTVGFTGGLIADGAEGGAIATMGRGIAAFTNDLRSVNVATAFASGNAAATYQQSVNDQTDQYKKANGGQEPEFAELQDIQDKAMRSAKVDGAINAYAMLMLEKAAFGNLLNSKATLQEAIQNSGRGIYDKVGIKPSWAEGAAEEPLYIKQQAKWYNMKANLTNNYYEGARHIGAKGLEFGVFGNVMDGIDKGVKSYFDARYDNKDISVFDAFRKGIDSQFTKDGKNTFISGFLQGALLMGIGGAALGRVKDWGSEKITGVDGQIKSIQESARLSGEAEEFVNKVNDLWKDPLNPVKDTIHDMVISNALNEQAKSSLSTNNSKQYHDTKDDNSRLFLLKMIKNGLADMWVDRMGEYARTLGQEDICKMLGVGNTPENYQQIKDQIAELPGRIKSLKRISKTVEDQLGSPFNPWAKDPNTGKRLYADGSEEFQLQYSNKVLHDSNKDMLIMMHDEAERKLVRQVDLLNGKGTSKGILGMPFAENLGFVTINTAMSPDLLGREISDYQQELDLTDKGKGKGAIEDKKLAAQGYKDVLDKYVDGMQKILAKGAYPERADDIQAHRNKYRDELTTKLHKYIDQSLNSINIKGDVLKVRKPPTVEQVRDGIDKMMDYYDLGMEHDRMLDNLNMLLDPSIIKKFQMSFLLEGTKHQQEAIEAATAEVKGLKKERETLLSLIQKYNTPGEGEFSDKEERIKKAQDRINEIDKELSVKDKNHKPASSNSTPSSETTPTTSTPTPDEPKPPVPTPETESETETEPIPNNAAIKANLREYMLHASDISDAIAVDSAPPIFKLSADAVGYIADRPAFKRELETLKSQLISIYGNSGDKEAEEYIDKLLNDHFDKGVAPLDYNHLSGSPKVEGTGPYTVVGKTYDSVLEANTALDKLYPKFDVQGREFQVGQYLYDKDGKQFILKEQDVLIPATGKSPKPIQVTGNDLIQYTNKKPEAESGKPVIPDSKYRLQNVNEIVEVRPPGKDEDEKRANQVIIDKILTTIPKDQIGDYLSIRVTKGPRAGEPTYDNALTTGNPYITLNRDAWEITVYRNGSNKNTPMFYIQSPNKYLFTNPFTGQSGLSVPEKDWFEYVFETHGKPVEEVYNQWMANYAKSQQLAEIISTGQDINTAATLHVSDGGYDFIPRSESDKWPTIADTIGTGKQLLSVIDQRTSDVVYGRHDKRNILPAEPNEFGGYLGEFGLPNGQVRYAQIVAPEYAPEELNALVTDYVTKASGDIKALVAAGDLDGAQAMSKLATDKLKNLFITQPPKSKSDNVVSFTIGMKKEGNLNIGFRIASKGADGIWTTDTKHHITINSGVGIDKPATGQEFIQSLQEKANNYFRKKGLPEVAIKPDNIRKGYTRDENKQISQDLIMQSKITTSTDIIKDQKVSYIVDKSAMYQAAVPTNIPHETVTKSVEPVQQPVSDIEAKKKTIRDKLYADQLANIQNPHINDTHRENNNRVLVDQYKEDLARLEQPIRIDVTDIPISRLTDTEVAQELVDKYKDDPLAIRRANRNSAKKLVPVGTLSSHEITTIQEFDDWMGKNLPDFIQRGELVPRMVNGHVTAGEFVTSARTIYTGHDNPYKYHEAFHAVYRTLLYSEEQKRLIDEANRVNPITAKEWTNFQNAYGPDSTKDEFQEEWMADKFEDWKKDHNTPLADGIRGWFQKLWNLIKELYHRFTGSQIEAMFYKMDRGAYKHAKLQDNEFTQTTTANDSALKLIEVGTNPDGSVKYLPQEEGQKLSSTIAALYHMGSLVNKGNKRQLIESILNNYKETLNPEQQRYDDMFLDKYKANKLEATYWDQRLNEQYEVFNKPKSRESLIEAIDEHLKIMGYKQDINDTEIARIEEQVGAKNYDTNSDEVGGYESLQNAIREYIGSTIVPYTDEFGNSELANGQPMYQAVDGSRVYNGLSQVLKNIPDINDMIDVMVKAKDSGDTGAVITRLFSDTGFIPGVDGQWSLTKNQQLFIQFINGFRQASVNHLFVEAGTGGGQVGTTTRAYEANRRSTDRNQTDIWADSYNSMYQHGYDNTTAKKTYTKCHLLPLTGGNYTDIVTSKIIEDIGLRGYLLDHNLEFLDEKGDPDDNKFIDKCQSISNDIKEQLGLSIHPVYIQYSIAKAQVEPTEYMSKLIGTYKADPIAVDDLEFIRTVMLDGRNPFIDALSKLRNIAAGNGVFDDTVDSTTHQNAEGKTIYGRQAYNYILEQTIKLNSDKEIERLKTDPNTAECHLLTDEKWLNYPKEVSVVDGIAMRFHKGTGDDIETPNIDTNKSEGSSMKNFNTRELAYYIFSIYQNPKVVDGVYGTNVIPAVISDKSRMYMSSAPIIAAVYHNKENKLRASEGALSKLYNVAQEEANRILRVQHQIDTWTPEQMKRDGIVDWHTGKLNGLKFDRARQMLGDLINPDGTMKEEGLPKQYPVQQQIEKHFLDKDTGAVLRCMDKLIKMGLLAKTTTEYENKMLPEYLFKGIPGIKGDGLNLKADVVHNIAQVYISNFINADGYTHLLSPNGINTKRLSFWNADGPGAAKPNIIAPELGIDRPFTEIHMAIMEDPKDENKFDQADSQGWITEEGMRHLHWGFGTLTQKRADAITKVATGKRLSDKEVFGKGGLVESGDMINPLKPVFYDGYTGIKLSVHMLSKNSVMVKGPGGKYIPDVRRMELYKIWRTMRDNEEATGIPSMVVPKSASKLQTKNVASSVDDLNTSHFTSTDANYWRKQLENPSNKLDMTKPTQPVWQLGAEQDGDVMVNGVKISKIVSQYGQDVANRLQTNWNNALNDLFSIAGDKPLELASTTELSDIHLVLGKFFDSTRDIMQATGANEQTLGFLETRDGEPIYPGAMDFPATSEKLIQLTLNYFGKVMREQVPGITATKVSPFGYNILREIYEVDTNGSPVPGKWRVIPDSEYEAHPEHYSNPITYTDVTNRTHSGLKPGDVILDHLRANVPEYKNGIATGIHYSEYIVPRHHAEDDGSIDSPVAKGYRNDIPYAAGNNGNVFIRVNTLPAELGSIEINPSVQSQSGGKDHDADKDYLQIADTYSNGEKLVKYGTATTDKDKFEEYLMYQATRNKQIKDQIKQVQDTDEGFIASVLGDDRQVLIQALANLKLPSTVQEFIARGGENLNVGVLNNRELEAKIAMAGNSYITGGDNPINMETTSTKLLSDMIKPGGSGSLYDVFSRKLTEDPNLSDAGRRNIEHLLESFKPSAININEMGGQLATADIIWPAKNSVGVAANGVPVQSFLLQHPIEVPNSPIRFDGKTYDNMDSPTTNNGTRKFTVMMTYINTMTDNAKLDGLAAKLGLTREALSDAMSMNAVGIDPDIAILYMLQPAVKKYYSDIAYIRGTLKSFAEEKTFKSRVLQDAIDSYEQSKPIELNRTHLESNIVEPNDSAQLSALLDIQKATELGSSLFNLSKVLGMAGGLPASWEEFDSIRDAIQNLQDNALDIHKAVMTDPITSKYIQMLTQLERLSPLLFMERSVPLNRLLDIGNANMRPVRQSEKVAVTRQRKQDMISYLAILATMNDLSKKGAIDALSSMDNSLIYDIPGNKITDTYNYLKKKLTDKRASYIINNFLRPQLANDPANKSKTYKLDSNNWAKLSDSRQIQIRDSYMALPEKERLILFNYLLVKDGGQFKAGSFIKYIAPAMFKDLLDNTAKVKQALASGHDDKVAQELFSKSWSEVMNNYVKAQGLHVDNKYQLQSIKIPYKTIDAIYMTEGNLQIDLLKGNIANNITALEEVGFKIVSVDTGKIKDDKPVMHRQVELPYTFKSGEQVYQLLNNQIEKGNNIATGTRGVYKPTDTQGARNTLRVGAALFGPVPYTGQLLSKLSVPEQITKLPYSPDSKIKPVEQIIKPVQEQPIQPNTNQEAIKALADRHGIFVVNEQGKNVAYDGNGNKLSIPTGQTPKQLLHRLDGLQNTETAPPEPEYGGYEGEGGMDDDKIAEMARKSREKVMQSEPSVVSSRPMQQDLFSKQSIDNQSVIQYPYPGVENLPDSGLTTLQSNQFIDLIQPQILKQAYVENKARDANRMFAFGLRWTKKVPNPEEKSAQRAKGLEPRPDKVPIQAFSTYDGYGYYKTDQNNQQIAPLTAVQPIINFIQNKLGIDMKDYDSVLCNIYEPDSYIHQHRDITESKTAKGYPVIVINLGASGGLIYHTEYSDESKFDANGNTYNQFLLNKNAHSNLPIQNGGIYAFGVDGKNRFSFNHRVERGIGQTPTKPLQVPVFDDKGSKIGEKTLKDYRITLTFRRAQDVTGNIPKVPKKLQSQQPVVPSQQITDEELDKKLKDCNK